MLLSSPTLNWKEHAVEPITLELPSRPVARTPPSPGPLRRTSSSESRTMLMRPFATCESVPMTLIESDKLRETRRVNTRIAVRMQAAIRTLKFLNDQELAVAPPGNNLSNLPLQLRQLVDSLGRCERGKQIPGLDSLLHELDTFCTRRRALSSRCEAFALGGLQTDVFAHFDDLHHVKHLSRGRLGAGSGCRESDGFMRTADL